MKRALSVGATLFGAATFAYTISAIGLANVEQAIGRVGWAFAAILLLSSVREVAKAAAWTQTFTGTHRLSVVDAFCARLAGEAWSALVPMGFVVGEPTKARYVDDQMPFATAFSGLMLELAFYTASLGLFAITALIQLAPSKAVLVVGVTAVAFVLALKPVRRAVTPVRRFVIDWPMRAGTIAALEIVYHGLGLAETYMILRFVSPDAATWTHAVAFETISRGVSIVFKMVPMRVGVDEASAALTATRLALNPSTGLMLALVRKLRVLFWTALGLVAIAARTIRRCAPARTHSVAELQKSA